MRKFNGAREALTKHAASIVDLGPTPGDPHAQTPNTRARSDPPDTQARVIHVVLGRTALQFTKWCTKKIGLHKADSVDLDGITQFALKV